MTKEDRDKFGFCRSVTITCISEAGWHDGDQMEADINAGGPDANQWDMSWQGENGAGCTSLIEIELLDGSRHKFLFDCGWNETYIKHRFEQTGVDRLLANGEIDFLFLSHEHLDHLWGLQAVLGHQPDLPIRVPSTFSERAMAFIRGEQSAPDRTSTAPLIPHTGSIFTTPSDTPTILYPGCVAVTFDLPILLGVRGEQSLFFRIKDKGTVCVTGCCHQTVNTLANYALNNIATESTLYGLYGGLHISPLGHELSPEQEQAITDLQQFGFQKIAANHCTGAPAIQRMIALGYPVVNTKDPYEISNTHIPSCGETIVFD